jgi:hypothetical protein
MSNTPAHVAKLRERRLDASAGLLPCSSIEEGSDLSILASLDLLHGARAVWSLALVWRSFPIRLVAGLCLPHLTTTKA